MLIGEELIILEEYSDFANVFLEKSAVELLEHTCIKNHNINLGESKQPPYEPIYSLGPVELEIFKTYIKTNLVNEFIRSFKSPIIALILFMRKLDRNLWLCINYRDYNNLTIKNKYLLPLIGELFNHLSQAKRITQLDLISAYY